jgi:hypothetical protein
MEKLTDAQKSELPLLVAFDSNGSGISEGRVLTGRIYDREIGNEDRILLLEPLVMVRMIMLDQKSHEIQVGHKVLNDALFPVKRDCSIEVNLDQFQFFYEIDPKKPKSGEDDALRYYEHNLGICFARAAGLTTVADAKKS